MHNTVFLWQGHNDWKKFRKALPAYLPEMDKMFAGVVVDGSTSFVPGQPSPIECDSSEEEGTEDQDDPQTDDLEEPFTPASVNTKRASSTGMTTSSLKKQECSSKGNGQQHPKLAVSASRDKRRSFGTSCRSVGPERATIGRGG